MGNRPTIMLYKDKPTVKEYDELVKKGVIKFNPITRGVIEKYEPRTKTEDEHEKKKKSQLKRFLS